MAISWVFCSRKPPSHILSCFRITTKTRLCLKEPFENLAALFRQNEYVRIVFAMEAREGPNAEDEGDRLTAATGHRLEDMIPAINLVLLARKCQYVLAPSVLQSRHFRVQVFDHDSPMVWVMLELVHLVLLDRRPPNHPTAWNFTTTFVLESSLSPMRQNWTLRHFDPCI